MASVFSDQERQRLREAGSDELLDLVRRHAEQLDPGAAQAVLRNPFCTEEVVRLLLDQRRLLSYYEVRSDLAASPRTPRVEAIRFVGGLFWRDLVTIGLDVRVAPMVRRQAENRLLDRLPGLAVGERIAIARRAPTRVLQALARDPQPGVVRALLDNPRCTELVLLPVVSAVTTPPPVLETIAASPKWVLRYPIRVALCRNPNFPGRVALGLLSSLKKADQRVVAADRRLPSPTRRRAALLSGSMRNGSGSAARWG